jgi:hypothetical protein
MPGHPSTAVRVVQVPKLRKLGCARMARACARRPRLPHPLQESVTKSRQSMIGLIDEVQPVCVSTKFDDVDDRHPHLRLQAPVIPLTVGTGQPEGDGELDLLGRRSPYGSAIKQRQGEFVLSKCPKVLRGGRGIKLAEGLVQLCGYTLIGKEWLELAPRTPQDCGSVIGASVLEHR